MTPPPRLKSKLRVQALLRTCQSVDLFCLVARKGDEDAGDILIKLRHGSEGFSLLSQTRDPEGELAWMRLTGALPVPEAQADALLTRRLSFDSDLWVVEIEETARQPAPLPGTIL